MLFVNQTGKQMVGSLHKKKKKEYESDKTECKIRIYRLQRLCGNNDSLAVI